MADATLACFGSLILLAAALFVIFYIIMEEGRKEKEAKEAREKAMVEEFYRKAKEGFEEKKKEDRKKFYKELLIKGYAEGRIGLEKFNNRMKNLKDILEGRSTVPPPSICPACGAPVGEAGRCEYCGLHFSMKGCIWYPSHECMRILHLVMSSPVLSPHRYRWKGMLFIKLYHGDGWGNAHQ